ncbi:MAG: hypothetical protein QFE16_03300 [Pseudomonadota bacterium]|nr:hypothetical protein [Pseudomonadota bacterium]
MTASAVPVHVGSVALPDSARERARKRLVWTVLLIYLLAIFEGAIRKYIAPQFGQYIFFIRDPFLIYAYILATRFGMWPRNQGFFTLSLFMCVFGVLLFILQVAVFGMDNTRLLLGIYGWRSYFFYVPLAFLVGAQFRREDLRLFARVTLLVAVPIAVLVVAQFSSPPNAPINVGVAEEKELQFKSVGITVERIRTAGTFTSPGGQQQFIASAFAFVLAMLLVPKRQVGLVFLTVTAGGVLTCLALSGSRGAMLLCGVIGLFAMGIGFVGRSAALRTKALVLPLSLGAALIVLYPIVFPVGFETFMTRWNAAAGTEATIEGGVLGRALLGLVDFVRFIDFVPVLGYGIGYGGNASTILGAEVDGIKVGWLAEADFSRQMVDLGPVFGICYIVMRIALTIWLGQRVWLASRRAPDPLPILLFAYASYQLLFGQITGNGTINVYGWLFTGLCIAASREALSAGRERNGVAFAASKRRMGFGRLVT